MSDVGALILEMLLRGWADARTIPSGPFVSEDLRAAAAELSRLRAENEALRNTLMAIACIGEKMREALRECAAELAERVEYDYAQTKHHPGMARRYERDMAPVVQARAALGLKAG